MTDAPRRKFWSAGKLSLLALLVIVLAFWRPWYSHETRVRFDELRSNVPELSGTSIEAFLTENPSRRNDPIFRNEVPSEYRTLDNAMFYAAIAGCVWLVLVFFRMIFRTALADHARGEQHYTLTCPYCSHVIADNVRSLGQTMTCSNCKAVVHAKDMRWQR
jgi:hypothetical protein